MTCKTCKGRGRFQVKETYSDGDEVLQWYECNDCEGTGVDQEASTGDDFDIGGSSYAEED
jgi:DnaJ-class molecular chaperone